MEYSSVVMTRYDKLCSNRATGPGVVLTAAHCVDGAGIVAVTFGAHDKEHYEQTQFTIPTREIVMHEGKYWKDYVLSFSWHESIKAIPL